MPLLLEDGGYLLLEDGGRILLEDDIEFTPGVVGLGAMYPGQGSPGQGYEVFESIATIVGLPRRWKARPHWEDPTMNKAWPPTPAISRVWIGVDVDAKEDGELVDPSTDLAELAFVPKGGEFDTASWQAAVWETTTEIAPGQPLLQPIRTALVLIGPGTPNEFTAGSTWRVGLRVHGQAATPVIPIEEQLLQIT